MVRIGGAVPAMYRTGAAGELLVRHVACGAVITDRAGNVVTEGRNRAFDEPSGEYPLEGTVLAHAEMNALARVPTGVALDDCTLWSSLEPCLMCLSSALLSSVGEIRFLAPDPLWDGVERLPTLNAFVERRWRPPP